MLLLCKNGILTCDNNCRMQSIATCLHSLLEIGSEDGCILRSNFPVVWTFSGWGKTLRELKLKLRPLKRAHSELRRSQGFFPQRSFFPRPLSHLSGFGGQLGFYLWSYK